MEEKGFPKTLPIIPDVVIYDNILPRLSVKSLIRFKCVSKTWNNVISTPQFTKSHLHFSLSSPHCLLKTNHSVYTLPYTLNHLLKLDHSWNHHIDILGSCNGLICLFVAYNSLMLWNPLTFQLRQIETPFLDIDSSYLCKLGFDYVPSIDDYKIVISDVTQDGLWVLSLRPQQWNYINFPSYLPFYGALSIYQCSEIFLDGILYWDVSFGDMVYICSFSLVDEQFNQETPFFIPPSVISHVDTTNLYAFKGCLSIMCNLTHQSDVFVMKRQGGLASWEKLFSIPNMSHVIFVDFVDTGKCLIVHERYIDQDEGSLAEQWKFELKLVDPTLEDLEDSQGIDFEHGGVDSVHHYVESLISPFTLM